MKKSTKRLLTTGVILVVVAIVGTVLVYFAVNTMFSKVTQTISGTDFLQDENQEVRLPVLVEGEERTVQVDMNAENLKKLESYIPFADKFAVLSLLGETLPAEEYSRLIAMLSDGITQEEIAEAFQILRANLTPEQKKQIKQYYSKYTYLLEQ